MKNTLILITICIGSIFICQSQSPDTTAQQGNQGQGGDEAAAFKQIEQDDETAIDAIAMYPEQTRVDILEASKYPEIIVRLNSMQKSTKQAFVDMVTPYSKDEQERIWDMTRYPSLISDIAGGDNPKSEADINQILLKYPEEVRANALQEAQSNYGLLHQIAQKNAEHDADFENLIAGYPPVTANAYRSLLNQPEVLNTLSDNMQMTVVIGDLYKKDPQWVLYKTDSMNQYLTQQNAQAATDWQKSLNDDPKALKEYTEAAQQYAQDNNIQPSDYTPPSTTNVTIYNNTNPYNWWYGYPTWYPYAYWNPYPAWYDLGFYYGPGGNMVFMGMPSSHFMNWYFYNPVYWNRYPMFGSHCYDFYNNHLGYRYGNPVNRGVGEWRERNRDVVNGDWDRDRAGRTERFKQFGKMETERNRFNERNPDRQMSRSDFMDRNPRKFGDIRASQTPMNGNANRGGNAANQQRGGGNQQNNGNYRQQQGQRSNAQQFNGNRSQGQRQQQQSSGRNQQQSRNNYQQQNAQQFHQNTWNRVQSQPSARPSFEPHPARSFGGGGGGNFGGGNRGGGGFGGGGGRGGGGGGRR